MIFLSAYKLRAFTLLFFISTTLLYAQDNQLTEIRRLEKLCQQNRAQPDSLLIYTKQLDSLVSKSNNEQVLLSAYTTLGISYARLRKFEKSNINHYKALSIAKKNKYEKMIFGIYNNLANNHRSTLMYDSTYYYYRKLIAYYRFKGDIFSLSLAYGNKGRTFFENHKLDSAAVNLKKAIDGFKKIRQPQLISQNLHLLAQVLFFNKDYKAALKNMQTSLAIAKQNKLPPFVLKSNYNFLAKIYHQLGNEEASKKYYNLEESIYIDADKIPKTFRETPISKDYNRLNVLENKRRRTDLVVEKSFYKKYLEWLVFISVVVLIIAIFYIKKYFNVKKDTQKLQKQLQVFNKKILRDKNNFSDTNNTKIVLKSKALLNTADILYIKSDGHYVEYYLVDKEKPEIDRNTLIKLLDDLPNNFVRIHKSFIVNIHHIKIINSTKLMLINGVWLNLSRTYKQQLKDILYKN